MAQTIRPTLGVVVPTFNRPEYLDAAIDSVLPQLRPSDALVVVDDGSTKPLPERLLHLSHLGRLQLIRQSNGGVARAMNRGASALATDYLLFTGDDDVLVSGALDALRGALDARPEAVMAAGGARNWFMPDGRLSDLSFPDVVLGDFDELLLGCPYFAGAVMLRRSAFVAVGGFEERIALSEDWDLYLKLSRLGSTVQVPVEAMHYRRHPDSMTGSLRVAAMAVTLVQHYLRVADPGVRSHRAARLVPGVVRRYLRQVAWRGQQSLKAGRFREAGQSLHLLGRLHLLALACGPARSVLRDEWRAY